MKYSDYQVDGSHYRTVNKNYQLLIFCDRHYLFPSQCKSVKYVQRYDRKHTDVALQERDLLKARHVIGLMIENCNDLVDDNAYTISHLSIAEISTYIKENQPLSPDQEIIVRLLFNGHKTKLEEALQKVDTLIKNLKESV